MKGDFKGVPIFESISLNSHIAICHFSPTFITYNTTNRKR